MKLCTMEPVQDFRCVSFRKLFKECLNDFTDGQFFKSLPKEITTLLYKQSTLYSRRPVQRNLQLVITAAWLDRECRCVFVA